jgi:transketolase
MIAIRDAYGGALAKLGEENPDVVVLEADVGTSSKSCVFGARFPDRYFNLGISELNLNAMAAGFASCGLIPFTNTFAVFMALRGGDPVNSLICHDNLNVKLAGAYCGLSDSYDGASHHSTSDLAMMISLPNMTVISVCDPIETEKAVFAAAAHDGPVYLRLSRAPSPAIFSPDYDFRIGKGEVIADGHDVCLIATGYMVHKAIEAAELLKWDGISAAVLDIHTIKPLDEELIESYARRCGSVVVAEEHSVHGGLGAAVSMVLARRVPVRMEFAGLNVFAESGDYERLLSKYGLDAAAIYRKAKELLKAG